ncbi:cold-shock protein [Kitasatospora sp. NE20-6]|uniref:cold-shock protein n=1 Tax=Kitasatospora sp. NE20-6 TaxID=2859066 RepID=UPI0034DC5F3D
MAVGTVSWFDDQRGFGFVKPEDGGMDIFVHARVVKQAGLQTLESGARVDVGVAQSGRGPQAVSITVRELPRLATPDSWTAENMLSALDDLLRTVDSFTSQLRRGEKPNRGSLVNMADLLRAVARRVESNE